MKIVVIAICKNEEEMLPFFFRHYDRFVDEYLFFDNISTDKTVEMIEAHPNARVVPFETLGYQKEEINTIIRNQAYRRLPLNADWFLIVDIDEFICHDNIRNYLEDCEKQGVKLPRVAGYNVYNEERPIDDGEMQITEWRNHGLKHDAYSKFCVLHKDVDVKFEFGSHWCDAGENAVTSEIAEISLLHYHVHHVGPEGAGMRRKMGYKFSEKTNELITRGATERYGRAITRAEGLKYRMPVFVKEFPEFINGLMAKAKTGDPDAYFHIGLVFQLGHMMEKDISKATNWFDRAAAGNHELACYQLGMICLQNKDLEKALQLFIKGAELGQSDCLFQAGYWLRDEEAIASFRDKVSEHIPKWLEYLTAASDKGHSEASYELFIVYAGGEHKDPDKSLDFLIKAAKAVNIPGLYSLGAHYFNAGQYEEAFIWLKRAAERGSSQAYNTLNIMMEGNLGISDDMEKAKDWFSFKLKRMMGSI